jgi:hypothetical protein
MAMKTFTGSTYSSALEEVGWFEGAPDEFREVVAERLESHDDVERPVHAFYADICVAAFENDIIDGEGESVQGSYFTIIDMLVDSSFDLFKPTRLTDKLNRKKGTATVSFMLGKKPFSIEVPLADGYFQTDVVDVLINGALAAVGVTHRFRALPTKYQHTSYAFVPDEVWKRASKAGLVSSTIERKRCSEKQLVATLPKSEGVAGLREYTTSMREGIVTTARAQQMMRLDLPGFGMIGTLRRTGLRPGRRLIFKAARELKDAAAGKPVRGEFDNIVTALHKLLRAGYESVPLAGVGTLTLDAGDPSSIDFEYDRALSAMLKDA